MLGMKFADDLTKIVDPIAEGWTGGSFEVMSTNVIPRMFTCLISFRKTLEVGSMLLISITPIGTPVLDLKVLLL